ncbi:hypothetical protein [Streptomyces sp. 184]|uniref:hypothetical protein n=1 Tax=Streptomyces sp. 184 TaxID=1827526 RepID=UPI0038918096
MTEQSGDAYEVRTRDVSGQVVTGRDNVVTRTTGARNAAPVSQRELEILRAEFARIRGLVPDDEPHAERARELLGELEEAATAPEPDLTTMDYVRRWFTRSLPALAGAVAGVVVHPVVGHLVEAAGGGLAEEFRQRFGDGAAGEGQR